MSSNVVAIGAVAILVALIVAFAYLQSRPQRTWTGQLIDDLGGLPAIFGAFV